jgi:pyruvate dehydrogenase E2 component (dihydrolipoamide acetyltransferase)
VSAAIEVRIPNIGDFKDIAVIDVLVKPGDTVKVDDPLVTLESDKAAMDVPSPANGVVQDVAIKIGDKVSEGSAVLTLSADSQQAAPATAADPPAAASATPRTADAPADKAKTAFAANGEASTPPVAPAAEQTIELRVPDIGDFKDVPVIEVLVKEGDVVEREAPLAVLESEKAAMEIPSTDAGRITSVALKPGDKVSQGSLIATLVAAGSVAAASAPAAPAAEAAPTAPSTSSASSPPPVAPAAAPSTGAVVHASPSIRRFARELGVALGSVRGSGPSGRITREDVQAFVKTALSAPATGGALPFALPPWPKLDFAQFGPIENKALTRIQKLSGPNLQRNWITIPHVTNNDEADITDLEALRQKLNAENDAKVTILAFLIKACVAALVKFPDFNSSLDGDHLILKKYYNIGFAADTPNGLVVPVIKGVDLKGVLAIAAETRTLAAKARDGKLSATDMAGGTFTISSLGGIGGTTFSPIINAPEVAIMGASRAAMRPVWNGRKFEPKLMLPLSLSYDHRVIDGAAAARFNAHVASLLADMRLAVL